MNKNKNLVFIVITSVALIFGGFFAIYLGSTATNNSTNVNNSVNNQITNNVVTYDDLNINDVSEAIEVAVAKVSPACVGIHIKTMVESEGHFAEVLYGSASGVIYKRDEIKENGSLVNYKYYVITNKHVVTDDKLADDKLITYVYLGDYDREVKATVVGYDPKLDIALVTFLDSLYIDPVKIADSDELKTGSLSIAVGNLGSLDCYNTVTFGVISSPDRYISSDTDGDGTDDFYAKYLQHDVAINPGNSGGGLFNLKGELIGINTLKIVATSFEGIGFAIPINEAMIVCRDYLETGKEIVRPKLGVLGLELKSLTPSHLAIIEDIKYIPDIYNGEQPYGIYVTQVYEGTTIGNTDISVDDIILAINDIDATRTYIINSKLNSLTNGFKVGETVTIKYYDNSSDSIKTVDVILKK